MRSISDPKINKILAYFKDVSNNSSREERAITLTSLILDAVEPTTDEKKLQKMLDDPQGRLFATAVADQCFRSVNSARVADQFLYELGKYGVPHFLPFWQRWGLSVLEMGGVNAIKAALPYMLEQIRKEASRVILTVDSEGLQNHLQKRQAEGVVVNLNHLGEAILSEQEAQDRLNLYGEDLKNPLIPYISIKISTLYSQISLLAWSQTLSILKERLRNLYREAKKYGKFVNLDMEEYRDLQLTFELFCAVLDEAEFRDFSAGIVLQSYLPDSFALQEKLTQWAINRQGAPIKLRIVKGANLAMEQVEASLRHWPQAPFNSKEEVDAQYKKMVEYGMRKRHAQYVHLGIASHNLFDIAYALLLRQENSVEEFVDFEMLEGMAESTRKVIQQIAGRMVLYTPTTTPEAFQYAFAYLIRRLDENTAPQNFLRHAFELKRGTPAWQQQVDQFERSLQDNPSSTPHRTQNRLGKPISPPIDSPFCNEADTDFSLPQNRQWVDSIVSSKQGLKPIQNKNWAELDRAITTASTAKIESSFNRSLLLFQIARTLREMRGELIRVMMEETQKSFTEADVEVSEAIDFAEYYRHCLEEWTHFKDDSWKGKGIVLVTPPWNFPCSIPAGGVLAALAGGNAVLFKPAPEAVRVGETLVQAFWKAGVAHDLLQFIPCSDDPEGTQLIQDPRIAAVVLTGATATAQHFMRLRPGLNLIAETGGKNGIIVTALSDRDLAVRDILQSAFGHAGQKCSACSLAVLEREVYADPHFKKALKESTESWIADSPFNLSARLTPLIRAPQPDLLRGLMALEPGEEWLLQPRHLGNNLWSPGIKWGVQRGSFTHMTELFGPVLGVMCAENLPQAIDMLNQTGYGLTSGLQSLDDREQAFWSEKIEAGNLYINRGITGAIVQRQPFGGWKKSSFGWGLKAGGPNYLLQFMDYTGEPEKGELSEKPLPLVHELHKQVPEEDEQLWILSVGSYAYFWNHYFSQEHDPSQVLGEDNLLRYVPSKKIHVYAPHPLELDRLRILAAALTCGATVTLLESEDALKLAIQENKISRLRCLVPPSPALWQALADQGISAYVAPISPNGRIELLHYLKEQSLSHSYHRYGYLGARAPEFIKPKKGCSGCSCN